MSSFAFIGTAGAQVEAEGRNKTCYDNPSDVQAEGNYCYQVDTWVQPDEVVPLGTPVFDRARIEKHWCNTSGVNAADCNENMAADSQQDENEHAKYVTFKLYENGYCDGEPIEREDVNVWWDDHALWAESSEVTLPAGVYGYRATFHRDSKWGHIKAYGYCEPFEVLKADPTLTTEIVPSDFVESGSTVHDTATLIDQVDGFPATGDVNFTFYNNGHCLNSDGASAKPAGLATLDEDGFAGPSDESNPLADGEYSYSTHYEGDLNYNPVDGPCEALNVRGGVITPVTPVNPPAVAPANAAAAVVAAARFTG